MSYNDMIGWALENIDTQTRIISNSQKDVFRSFQLEKIRYLWGNPNKFRADTHDMYATPPLEDHMIYVAMILSRIFKKKISTHFPLTSVPIMHEVVEGDSFN
jgi:hypothetical protein